eukprot:31163-Pelagococcus_subviridis.AAC.6
MSLLLYSELMIMSMRRLTSAWNSCCSAPSLNALSLWLTAGASTSASSARTTAAEGMRRI